MVAARRVAEQEWERAKANRRVSCLQRRLGNGHVGNLESQTSLFTHTSCGFCTMNAIKGGVMKMKGLEHKDNHVEKRRGTGGKGPRDGGCEGKKVSTP